MLAAVIDLGTNIFHLLIVRLDKQQFVVEKTAKAIVKLGENGITTNKLHNDAIQRGLHAIIEFKQICNEFNVSKIYAFGTAALRRAANANEFMQQVINLTGISIEIIDGDTEATFIWHGVKNAVKIENQIALIMDIGGGSTEFILADNNQIYWKKSFDIGAALLLEKFKPSDPITLEEITAINNFLAEEIAAVIVMCNQYKPKMLIGSSGSFDTFNDILQAQNNTSDNSNFNFLEINAYYNLHALLLQSTLSERLTMPGMIPIRADMIVMATLLTKLVLEKWPFSYLIRSAFALKEGIVYSSFFTTHHQPNYPTQHGKNISNR